MPETRTKLANKRNEEQTNKAIICCRLRPLQAQLTITTVLAAGLHHSAKFGTNLGSYRNTHDAPNGHYVKT